jgi:hypothetical protein
VHPGVGRDRDRCRCDVSGPLRRPWGSQAKRLSGVSRGEWRRHHRQRCGLSSQTLARTLRWRWRWGDAQSCDSERKPVVQPSLGIVGCLETVQAAGRPAGGQKGGIWVVLKHTPRTARPANSWPSDGGIGWIWVYGPSKVGAGSWSTGLVGRRKSKGRPRPIGCDYKDDPVN